METRFPAISQHLSVDGLFDSPYRGGNLGENVHESQSRNRVIQIFAEAISCHFVGAFPCSNDAGDQPSKSRADQQTRIMQPRTAITVR